MRIIYFDIDCLRPDHLGCYGYDRPTSPAIDKIAREGIRFEHYYCASSPCLPSRTGLLSGRFGIRNGVVSNHGAGARFRIETNIYSGPKDSNQIFTRQMMAHGMRPICFSNFADRHNALWFMYGWSEYHLVNLKAGNETAEEVNARILPWLEANAAKENYYLHINYWDAHRCYKMDASWTHRFRDYPVTQAWPDAEAIEKHQALTAPFTAHGQFPNDKSPVPLMPGAINNRHDFERMVTGYDAAIAYVDFHILQILDELERQGVLEETAVIISADHGDALGEHGIYTDHVNADECVQRVPLIVRWPGVTPPEATSRAFMYNVDFAPTICDLLGVPIPEDWDGQSYRANVEGKSGVDRDFLVWDTGLYTVQRAVRTKTHLYIRTYDKGHYENWRDEELYDMTDDPHETRNLAEKCPAVIDECRILMKEWEAQQKAKRNWTSDPLEEILFERGVGLARHG